MKTGVPDTGWFCLLCLPVACAIVYFFLLMRRKIGAFSRPRLQEYVSKTVFLQGILGCLPPIAYLTTESVKCFCLAKNMDQEEDIYAVCGGVILPTFSITLMLIFFLVVRLIFAPLSRFWRVPW